MSTAPTPTAWSWRASILTSLRHLPDRTESSPEARRERAREKEVAKLRLSELGQRSAGVRRAIDEEPEMRNGVVGEPASFDRLDAMLQSQSYRLASWRVAVEEINYRRFLRHQRPGRHPGGARRLSS